MQEEGWGGVGWQGRLLEPATSLSGIDIFVFAESVTCLITVLHFVFFITHKKHAKIPFRCCSYSHNDVPPPPGGLAGPIVHSCTHPAQKYVLYCSAPFQCGFNHAAVLIGQYR